MTPHFTYQRFQHRAVRDLAWALLSPSLFNTFDNSLNKVLSEDYIEETDALLNWLLGIDQNPQPLLDHITQRSQVRIGIYFEQLIGFYFKYYPRFDLLQQNLQVQGKQKTLGEFDFIVFDKTNKDYLHIETAVKFYLGSHDSSQLANNVKQYNWHEWVGPNKKDSLSLKMDSMLNKQLRLSKTDEAGEQLQALGITVKDLQPRLLLRGRFFCHNNSTPHFANTLACQFEWHKINAFREQKDNKETYCILPRTFWLSTINQQDLMNIAKPLNKAELIDVIKSEIKQAIHTWKVVRLNEQQNEAERFFIVDG